MYIDDQITQEEYKLFFESFKYNHFLQSCEWAELSKVKGQIPTFIALKNKKKEIVAAFMAFRKNLPFNMCYLYAPRGILIDYKDKELLNTFTEEIKKYLKKINAIYFKMDPAIIYQEIDEEANPIENGENNYDLYKYLIKLGYKHQGFNKLFEKNQPRYTFRIDTQRSLEEIENSMNKSYLKTIKRSYNYNLKITNEFNPKVFYNLINEIAKKDHFNTYPVTFYEKLKELYNEKNMLYITININPKEIYNNAKTELDNINEDINSGKINNKRMEDTKNIINRLNKDIETFEDIKEEENVTILTLICPFVNKKLWTLYLGNNNLATYTFAVNRSYYEAIKYAQENNFEFVDLFGSCGDPHTNNSNYFGVYEYKRKLGGTYTEFIGEFDLINKPIIYKILPLFIKVYRKLKKRND